LLPGALPVATGRARHTSGTLVAVGGGGVTVGGGGCVGGGGSVTVGGGGCVGDGLTGVGCRGVQADISRSDTTHNN
jgi:hypothetical protein